MLNAVYIINLPIYLLIVLLALPRLQAANLVILAKSAYFPYFDHALIKLERYPPPPTPRGISPLPDGNNGWAGDDRCVPWILYENPKYMSGLKTGGRWIDSCISSMCLEFNLRLTLHHNYLKIRSRLIDSQRPVH